MKTTNRFQVVGINFFIAIIAIGLAIAISCAALSAALPSDKPASVASSDNLSMKDQQDNLPFCSLTMVLGCKQLPPPPEAVNADYVMKAAIENTTISTVAMPHAEKDTVGYMITLTYPPIEPDAGIYLKADAKALAKAYVTELVKEGFDPSLSGGHPVSIMVNTESSIRTVSGKLQHVMVAYAYYDPVSDQITAAFYQ